MDFQRTHCSEVIPVWQTCCSKLTISIVGNLMGLYSARVHKRSNSVQVFNCEIWVYGPKSSHHFQDDDLKRHLNKYKDKDIKVK